MDRSPVSLVTVSYNSAPTLAHFWRDWPTEAAEWIVVDNASSDGSADVAESLGARVVRLDENMGFSAANNRGVVEAGGQTLGFLNPDVTPTRVGIDALADRVRGHDSIVAPQLINPDGSLQENGRGAPYPMRKLAHMFAPGSKMNDRYIRPVHGGLEQVVWVMGAAVFMRREVFDRIGRWDAGFFIYYEDSDICLRALRKGVPTYVDGDVRWKHGWARETATGGSASIWMHELRSAIRFYAKHPDCILPLSFRTNGVNALDRTLRQ